MRNLMGDVLGKADVDFDFGVAPWMQDGVLTGDLTYLYARRAMIAQMVNGPVASGLRESR